MRRLVLAVLLLVALAGVVSVCESRCPPCTVEVLFVSPAVDGVIEAKLIALLDQATSTVDIAIYSFTDDQLGDAVVRAHRRGVKVRVLLDDGQEEAQGGEYSKLKSAGVPVCVENVPGLFHHKFLVVDGVITATGSYNWTNQADGVNFENVVVIACSDVATAYTQEFGRLWARLCSPPPCDAGECLGKLNAVTYEQLLSIKGIGPAIADRIVSALPLSSLRELTDIARVGPARCCYVLTYLGCEGCCWSYCKE